MSLPIASERFTHPGISDWRDTALGLAETSVVDHLLGGADWRLQLEAKLYQAQKAGAMYVTVMVEPLLWNADFDDRCKIALATLVDIDWDWVCVSHSGGYVGAQNGLPSNLMPCEAPPPDINAVIFKTEALSYVLEVMPMGDMALKLADWLVLSCLAVMGRGETGKCWAAWPPLLPRSSSGREEAAQGTAVDFERDVHCLLGLPFDAIALKKAAAKLEAARATKARCFFSTPNLNFVVASQSDPVFKDSVSRSNLSLVDGMPLVWIAKILGVPVSERVSGSDLFEHLRQHSLADWRVYFFGGEEGVAQRASAVLERASSSMTAVGFTNPGFGAVADMSDAKTLNQINQASPDMVVVSLGAAKGQSWIVANLDRIEAPVVSHLGAVVNFVAGTVSRAPRWAQKSGLEWAWRIKEEPKLWRRYANDGFKLVQLMLTKVLPLAAVQRLSQVSANEYWRAYVCTSFRSDDVLISLGGAWNEGNLRPIRTEFHRLQSLAPSCVTIDFSDVTRFDSAFVGVLILFEASIRANGGRVRITGCNASLRRLMRLFCADDLIRE
jgi:N-acetylglucosaminyldiphosphoundecaprenol N-acetyl-beta-D-mannosaminyltransferase